MKKQLLQFVVLVLWSLSACNSEEENNEEGVCVEGEDSCNSLYS